VRRENRIDLELDATPMAIIIKSNFLIFVFKEVFIFFVHMGRLVVIYPLFFCSHDGCHLITTRHSLIFEDDEERKTASAPVAGLERL
jgi:hypothetical protein